MNKFIKKKIHNILSLAFCGLTLLSMTACDQKESKQENVTVSNEVKATDKDVNDVQISKEAEQVVLGFIQNEIAEGRLKKENIKDEDVIQLAKMITLAAQKTGGKIDGNTFESLLQNQHLESSDNLRNVFNSAKKDFNVETKIDNNESKKVLEEIHKNIPNMKIYSVEQEKLFPYYFKVTLDFKGHPFSIYTNANADYYLIPDNPEYGRHSLLNKDATVVDLNDSKATAYVYKDFLSKLDTSKFIKYQYGNGNKKVYIFTDPDCPFCRNLDQILFSGLNDKDNVTIYYVMNPILGLHPEAKSKGAKILCSDNPVASWKKWQEERVLPENKNYNEEQCMQKMDEQMIYPSIIGLTGTPTIITDTGFYIQGQPSLEQFREIMKQ